MRPFTFRIAQCGREKVEYVHIKGDENEGIDVIVHAVPYPGAPVRLDAALIGVEGFFSPCPGSKNIGDDNGDEGKQNGYNDEQRPGKILLNYS